MGKSSKVVDDYQNVLIAPFAFVQMDKVNGHQFKWVGCFDIFKGHSGLTTGCFLFDTAAGSQDIIFNVFLHVRPEKTIPNEACGAIESLITHLIMHLFQNSYFKLRW